MKPVTLFFAAAMLVLTPVLRAADDTPPPLPPPPEVDQGAKPVPGKTVPATGSDAALPTTEQIQATFDAGNYAETLKLLSRVLPLKGKAAEPYDKYKLSLLKAETHIKLKQQPAAISALNDAADLTDEEPAKYAATSLVQLIKKSKAFVFTPKPIKKTGKPPASLDLTDPIARKAAMQALLDEEMARVIPKVKGALEESSLPPLASAIEAARDVRELEVGVTGSDANTKAMVADLGARGRELITKTLEKMSKRVDEITKDANETVRIRVPSISVTGVRGPDQERIRRRGLKDKEPNELRDVINQLPNIAKASREFITATGGKKSEAEAAVEMCSELSKRAKKTLEADYSTF